MNNIWERKGECNSCGWCCQMVTRLTITIPLELRQTDEKYFQVRGFNSDGQLTGDLFAPCSQHDNKEKQCRIYDERPATCCAFPISPDQIINSPCTYWFERPTQDGKCTERVGGDSSPWPGHSVRPQASIKPNASSPS